MNVSKECMGIIDQSPMVVWMPVLCGKCSITDAFFSYNLMYNTSAPRITTCFEYTALVWIPVAILLILCPFTLFMYSGMHTGVICGRKSCLDVLKRVLLSVLFSLNIADIAVSFTTGLHPAHLILLAALLRLVATVIVAMYIDWRFRKGLHTSYVLLTYWAIICVCDGIRVLSHTVDSAEENNSKYTPLSMRILLCCEFGIESLLLIAHVPADVAAISARRSKDSPTEKTGLTQVKSLGRSENPCPDGMASRLNNLLFLWFWKMVIVGVRRPLTYEDVYDVRLEDSSEYVHSRFARHWHRLTSRSHCCNNKALLLAWAIFRTFWRHFVSGFGIMGLQSLGTLISPLLLSSFMAFIEEPQDYQWHGYLILVGIMSLNLTSTFAMQHSLYSIMILSVRIRVALTTAVYRKALKMSTTSVNVGEITNLMSVDAYRFQHNFSLLPYLIIVPFLIPPATCVLYQQLGYAALIGILWFLVALPILLALASKFMTRLQVKQMKMKDRRMTITNQVLSGIKILKFYAWETAFERRVLDIRDKELQQQRHGSLLFAFSQSIFFASPYLGSLLIFAMFLVLSGLGSPPVNAAFASMAVLNTLQVNLLLIPESVNAASQMCVSFQRLSKFLLKDELNTKQTARNPTQDEALVIANCSATWKQGMVNLKSISLRVPRGGLIAIVGPVGSGKSSLLSAILGEMEIVDGSVKVNGSFSYVPQQAWIQNLTLKENITFGKPYSRTKYQKVLSNCCLLDDLRILPGGDLTEIGEKGINLSGGQNQRVSLARACYQDNDIFVLDDPMSAVDAHVGRNIFNDVIGPNGILRHKTRIMVTNTLTFIDKVDYILVLNKGEISELGTFPELISHEGPFADFLLKHTKKKVQRYESGEEDDEVMEEEIKTLRKHLSSTSGSDTEFSDKDYDTQNSKKRFRKRIKKSIDHNRAEFSLISEEVTGTKTLSSAVVQNITKAASLPHVLLLVLGFTVSVLGNVGYNVWLSHWASPASVQYNIIDNGGDVTNMANFGMAVYALIGFVFVIGVLMMAFGGALGVVRVSRVLHQQLLSTVLKLPMSFFDTTPTGRIVNRFSTDIDAMDEHFRLMLLLFMFQLSSLCSTVSGIAYSTPTFLSIACVLIVIFLCIQRVYIKIGRQLKQIESVRRSPVFSGFSETLSGLSSIRSYQQQQRFVGNADRLLDDHVRSSFLVFTSNRWVGIYAGLLSSCVVFFSTYLAIQKRFDLDPGSAGLSLMYALTLNMQAGMILKTSCELENDMISAERIVEYEDLPTEAPHKIPENTPPMGWPSNGMIEFHDFHMRYRPELDLVLKGVTCRIDAGEKIAIVGRTGAGKSSMTLALFRIVEAATGSIVIDGLNIAQMGLHDVRGGLSIIPQEPVVFSGSIRDNLDPNNKHMDSEIWNSLEHSYLKHFVTGTGKGLDFDCGDDGCNMSVGQRQLLCLARALLRSPSVLILDEATAAIDLHTDDLIQQTIRSEFMSTTIITIAHRLNTVLDYDRILVMDLGRIAEFDTPDNLMNTGNSIFFSMAMNAGLI